MGWDDKQFVGIPYQSGNNRNDRRTLPTVTFLTNLINTHHCEWWKEQDSNLRCGKKEKTAKALDLSAILPCGRGLSPILIKRN